MKPKYSLHERIAVRAYYCGLANLDDPDSEQDWLYAEHIELRMLRERKEAARKGAATKRRWKHAEYADPLG